MKTELTCYADYGQQRNFDWEVSHSQWAALETGFRIREEAFANLIRQNWVELLHALATYTFPPYEIWWGGERLVCIELAPGVGMTFTAELTGPRFIHEAFVSGQESFRSR